MYLLHNVPALCNLCLWGPGVLQRALGHMCEEGVVSDYFGHPNIVHPPHRISLRLVGSDHLVRRQIVLDRSIWYSFHIANRSLGATKTKWFPLTRHAMSLLARHMTLMFDVHARLARLRTPTSTGPGTASCTGWLQTSRRCVLSSPPFVCRPSFDVAWVHSLRNSLPK